MFPALKVTPPLFAAAETDENFKDFIAVIKDLVIAIESHQTTSTTAQCKEVEQFIVTSLQQYFDASHNLTEDHFSEILTIFMGNLLFIDRKKVFCHVFGQVLQHYIDSRQLVLDSFNFLSFFSENRLDAELQEILSTYLFIAPSSS